MPIEVKKLGLQPKVEATTEIEKTTLPDGTNVYSPVYKTELVDSTETIATGAEIKDPEFAKLLDDSNDHYSAHEEKLKDAFGVERITGPDGSVTQLRGDQIAAAKQRGYGQKASAPRTIVPSLPWQDDRNIAEPWAAYVKRTGRVGKTILSYQDGRKLVITEQGLQIERGNQ